MYLRMNSIQDNLLWPNLAENNQYKLVVLHFGLEHAVYSKTG